MFLFRNLGISETITFFFVFSNRPFPHHLKFLFNRLKPLFNRLKFLLNCFLSVCQFIFCKRTFTFGIAP